MWIFFICGKFIFYVVTCAFNLSNKKVGQLGNDDDEWFCLSDEEEIFFFVILLFFFSLLLSTIENHVI